MTTKRACGRWRGCFGKADGVDLDALVAGLTDEQKALLAASGGSDAPCEQRVTPSNDMSGVPRSTWAIPARELTAERGMRRIRARAPLGAQAVTPCCGR
jgi:hypothetical protein